MNTLGKSIFTFFTAVTLLASCGGNKREVAQVQNTFGGTLSFETQPVLSDVELGVANRICESFRSKRSNFLLYNRVDKTYEFEEKTKDCDNQKSEKVIETNLNQDTDSGKFSFSGQEKNVFSLVQTHDQGYLTSICETLLKGSQDFKTIFPYGSDLIQVQFSKSSNDQFSVDVATSLSDGTYKVYKKLIYEVDTYSPSDSLKYGLIIEAESSSTCGNQRNKTITQEFKSYEK